MAAEENVREKEQLIAQARKGDVKAFSALVVLYQEPMLRAAYAFVEQRQDAEDIVQEAFVKAFLSLKTFQGKSRFSTWLYRIVINTSKDFLRKKKKTGTAELSPETPSQARDAFQNAKDQETNQFLLRALDKLPLRQKSVFALRYLQGLSLEEIATIEKLSLGAVKATLWQANQKMKDALGPLVENKTPTEPIKPIEASRPITNATTAFGAFSHAWFRDRKKGEESHD